MADDTKVTGPARFNHVAMSVPADLLDAQGRADLTAYYHEVFGWEELPTMTLDRERLILAVHQVDQFVFLIASETPMQCEPMDHFGVAASSLEELEEVLRRAEAYRARDDRVEIIDYQVEDFGAIKLHSFYARYLLPLMVEVQYFEMVG